jgi:hypothetical protein
MKGSEKRMLMKIKDFKHAITIACLKGQSLADFARDYKRGNLTITLQNNQV